MCVRVCVCLGDGTSLVLCGYLAQYVAVLFEFSMLVWFIINILPGHPFFHNDDPCAIRYFLKPQTVSEKSAHKKLALIFVCGHPLPPLSATLSGAVLPCEPALLMLPRYAHHD